MIDELVEKMARAIRDKIPELMFTDAIDPEPPALELARAAIAAIEASGTHVIAPIEPTTEMKVAAYNDDAAGIWRDMVACRPKVLS